MDLISTILFIAAAAELEGRNNHIEGPEALKMSEYVTTYRSFWELVNDSLFVRDYDNL